MENTMIKTTVREIKQSLGRYLAILAIVALGVGIFAGLKVTKPYMVETAESYLTEKQFYDFRLISTYGFESEDVAYLEEQDDARAVQGAYTYDVLFTYGDSDAAQVMKVHSLTEGVNELDVLYGRLPENPEECVVDAQMFGEDALGKTICIINENDEDTLDVFKYKEYTISGVVNSSYYIQFERGNTSIGNGKVAAFMYVPPESFDSEIFTEIFVKLDQDFELYSDEYEDYIETQEVIWEEHLDEVADQRFGRIQAEAQKELDEAKEEFETEKADAQTDLAEAAEELADAKEQLDEAYEGIREGKAQIADGWQGITEGYAELAANEQKLNDGAAEIETNRQQLTIKEQELEAGLAQLQEQQNLLNEQKSQLQNSETELNLSEQDLLAKEQEILALEGQLATGLIPEDQVPFVQAAIAAAKPEIEAGKQQIAAAREQINAGYAQITAGQSQLDAAFAEIESGRAQLEAGKAQLDQAEQELISGRAQLEDGRRSLAKAEADLVKAEADMRDGEADYQEGLAEYEDGLAEYEEGYAEFEAEIADAEAEIAEAEQEIKDLELPDCYILDRETNVGYVCLDSDSNIVEDVSAVLPVFFFLIAALVCMTTMNRMIEEQRTQIGVLKALGYNDATIMGKYLFYSGSAAGMGCFAGYFLGTFFLSKIIWGAYGMMYDMPELVYFVDWGILVFCFVCSMLSSVGVTWFSCRTELTDVAAALMRPKAPKGGKRVFLERIPFIWKHLSFLIKVSIRNVFRYKKRFFMMVIGISGCTGLLVTGFGINDSISEVTTIQYNEIQIYDMSVTFDEELTQTDHEELEEVTEGRIAEMDIFMEGSLDLTANGKTKSISIVVPEHPETIGKYISIHTLEDEPIAYPETGEAVISHKIAEDFGIHIGDTVELMDEDHNQFTVTISGICQNFVYNYLFLHPDTCSQNWKTPEFQTAYINMPEDGEDIHQVSADLMAMDDVANVTVNADVEERFNNMMSSMDFIIVVIILCAAALAFIVLFNLTNINITERIREIATIKVLGFTKQETASYVFRENVALTAIGGLAGLLLGKVFHAFVMSCINIDMVAFDVRIKPESYVYSIVLTFFFAWIVNLFMGGKLDKVSMTESLKSVD